MDEYKAEQTAIEVPIRPLSWKMEPSGFEDGARKAHLLDELIDAMKNGHVVAIDPGDQHVFVGKIVGLRPEAGNKDKDGFHFLWLVTIASAFTAFRTTKKIFLVARKHINFSNPKPAAADKYAAPSDLDVLKELVGRLQERRKQSNNNQEYERALLNAVDRLNELKRFW